MMLLTVSKLRSESTAREFISLSHLFMSRRNFVLHSVIQIVTTVKNALIYSNKETTKEFTCHKLGYSTNSVEALKEIQSKTRNVGQWPT